MTQLEQACELLRQASDLYGTPESYLWYDVRQFLGSIKGPDNGAAHTEHTWEPDQLLPNHEFCNCGAQRRKSPPQKEIDNG